MLRIHLSTVIAGAIGALILTTSCARSMHRRDGFGVANHAFFDRQAEATRTGTTTGLDPEEAALIHARYRETLGGRAAASGKATPESSVLILQEGDHAGTTKKQ